MRHYKVGVLYGGGSSERDISIRSGTAILNALKSKGYDAEGIDVSEDNLEKQLLTAGINVAFIALHGRFGEDGRAQEILERLNIPYTGSGVEASRTAIDKIKTKEILVKNGIGTPRYKVAKMGGKKTFLVEVMSDFRFPVVVKPALEGSSIGLSIVDDQKKIDYALEKGFSYNCDILIEEYIAGMELTVGILGDRALPVINVVPKNKFYDYEAKYTKGMTEYIVPAKLDDDTWNDVQTLALKTHKAIGCEDISRVDIILGKDKKLYVLEINTIPGFTETSLLPKAARSLAISFEDLCERILKMALKKRSRGAEAQKSRGAEEIKVNNEA